MHNQHDHIEVEVTFRRVNLEIEAAVDDLVSSWRIGSSSPGVMWSRTRSQN